ncbi:MAG: WG repeat-containing protein [Phycisphaerae bacterium]|nr:WG repeat-containing protein [Saprospiraceae bacterium]
MRFLCYVFFLTLVTVSTAQVPGAIWVVPPVIDSVESIEISAQDVDPRIIVKNKKKFGLYDRSGKKLLPVIYDNLSLQNGWVIGFLMGDPVKKLLFNERMEDLGRVYDKFVPQAGGQAVVYKNNLCGLINQRGEEIVPLKFDAVNYTSGEIVFSKGDEIKTVRQYETPEHPKAKKIREENARKVIPGYVRVYKNGLSGFTNMKGDTVVPALYMWGAIHPKGYIVASLDGKKSWGVIDTRHKTLRNFTASGVGTWSKTGYIPIREDKLWGLFKFPEGIEAIPMGTWDQIETYDAEREWFKVTKNKKTGLINAKGAVILPVVYDFVQSGTYLNAILRQGMKYGYWYYSANKLVEPKYTSLLNYEDSLLIVMQDKETALIDAKTEKILIPFSKFGIEKKGAYFVSDFKYDSTQNTTAAGRLHALYDRKGKMLLAPDSVDLHIFPDGSYFVVTHNKKSIQYEEHRSKTGDVLRKMDRISDYVNYDHWFRCSKNQAGKFEFSTFSYLDLPGKEQRYAERKDTKEKVHMVRSLEKKWGLTTLEGAILVPPVFEAMESTKDGYFKVKYEGKWGVLQNPLFDYFEQPK